ncbi:reprolysin-like metallopeptidase [Pseudoxanthomonas wuyuanensis]|uniref:Repeat domain-containing protein n=1 Tax=Pseudoxanthomonas wuyuanensis TaxID=1073196 RepID=A0A286D702_9GAMM|nr:M12 family metallo-peptidase [Pseudoxanthomonas wuyuanensis]KAF1719068.1 hypothetical protein CSC75_16600 [Pseudoxanthomonas wuyuanensis]SOD54394.1 Repeat domain-containing protein [Pseudoxanthomonas wuyuanensis]
MKFRFGGACASIILLAGCSGGDPGSQLGQLRGAASSTAEKNANLLAKARPVARDASQSIANSPDRGALMSYRNNRTASKQEGAYTWYPVAISEEHAIKSLLTGEMIIPSPDGSQVKLRYERHEEHPDGNWTWVGRLVDGDQMQEAIITFGEKAVYGSIPQPNGAAPLSLQTRSGSLFAVTTDLSKQKSPNSGTTDMMVPPALALRESLAQQVQQSAPVQQSATVMASAPPTSANTIDVAVGYTQGFRAREGSQSAAVTRLTFLMQVANQAYTNSNINGYLRMVRAVEVNYADNTKNSDVLSALTGHNGTSPVSIPSALQPLHTARNEYGADVVVLVRKFQTPENDGCGIAWLNGADQTAIVPSADDDFGFAVVSDGSDTGTDGNSYFCAPETLVHEVGHVMGSAHDRDNSRKSDNSLQYGAYAYSFGMKTDSSNGNFYTIMSYGDNNQTPYRTFSNPAITICGGRACGVANATDNARSLNQTIPLVAQFRATVVPFDSTPNLHVIKKQGSSGYTEMHSLTGYSDFQSYSRNLATTLARSGNDRSWEFQLGDYNGDGILDLYAVKKMGASGKTEVHIMDGKSGFKSYLLNVATAQARTGTDGRWEFRLGDYNKDGKLDLYGIDRTGGSGKTDVHVLSGADKFQTYLLHSATALGATGVNDAWKFELGDYNKDGNLDIYAIKKNGLSGRTEAHVLNGAGGFKSFLLNKATALGATGTDGLWDFKVADYDLDGKPDIYGIKRVGSSGKTEVHILSGASVFQSFSLHKATALGNTGTDYAWEFVVSK